jgi:hypothetical protein
MPGWRDTSMYGPVPLAANPAWLSSLFLKSSGRVTLCFSAQALLMMDTESTCCRKTGLTLSSRNSTVCASIATGVPSALA